MWRPRGEMGEANHEVLFSTSNSTSGAPRTEGWLQELFRLGK